MENIEELMKALENMKKMNKVRRRLRPKQKKDLVENEEFYCPYCLRKTEMHEIPTRCMKGNYSILVCDKCFTYLAKIP